MGALGTPDRPAVPGMDTVDAPTEFTRYYLSEEGEIEYQETRRVREDWPDQQLPRVPDSVEAEEDAGAQTRQADVGDAPEQGQQYVEMRLLARNFVKIEGRHPNHAYAWTYTRMDDPDASVRVSQYGTIVRMPEVVPRDYVYRHDAQPGDRKDLDLTGLSTDTEALHPNDLLSPLTTSTTPTDLKIERYEGVGLDDDDESSPRRASAQFDPESIARATSLVKHADVSHVCVAIRVYASSDDRQFFPLGGFVDSSIPLDTTTVYYDGGGSIKVRKSNYLSHIVNRILKLKPDARSEYRNYLTVQLIALPRSSYASPYILGTKTTKWTPRSGDVAIPINNVAANLIRAASGSVAPESLLGQPGGVSTISDMTSLALMGLMVDDERLHADDSVAALTSDSNARLRRAAILMHTRAAKEVSLVGIQSHRFAPYNASAYQSEYERFRDPGNGSASTLLFPLLFRTREQGAGLDMPTAFADFVDADAGLRKRHADMCFRIAHDGTPLFDHTPETFQAMATYGIGAFFAPEHKDKKASKNPHSYYPSTRKETIYKKIVEALGNPDDGPEPDDMALNAIKNLNHASHQAQMHANWTPEFAQDRPRPDPYSPMAFGWEWPYVCHPKPMQRMDGSYRIGDYEMARGGVAYVYECSMTDDRAIRLTLFQNRFTYASDLPIAGNTWMISTETSRLRAAMLLNMLVLLEGHVNTLVATLQHVEVRNGLLEQEYDVDDEHRLGATVDLAVGLQRIFDSSIPLDVSFLLSRRLHLNDEIVFSGDGPTFDELNHIIDAVRRHNFSVDDDAFNMAMYLQYMKGDNPRDTKVNYLLFYKSRRQSAEVAMLEQRPAPSGNVGLFCPKHNKKPTALQWMDGGPRYMRMYSHGKPGLRDDLVMWNDYSRLMYLVFPKNDQRRPRVEMPIESRDVNMNPPEVNNQRDALDVPSGETSLISSLAADWIVDAATDADSVESRARDLGKAIAEVMYKERPNDAGAQFKPSKLHSHSRIPQNKQGNFLRPTGTLAKNIACNMSLGHAYPQFDSREMEDVAAQLRLIPSAHLVGYPGSNDNSTETDVDQNYYHLVRGQRVYKPTNLDDRSTQLSVAYRHHIMWSTVSNARPTGSANMTHGAPSMGQAHLWGDMVNELLRLSLHADLNRDDGRQPLYSINLADTDNGGVLSSMLCAMSLRDALHHASLHARPVFEQLILHAYNDIHIAASALTKILTFACHMGNASMPNWMDFLRGDATALIMGIASGAYKYDHAALSYGLQTYQTEDPNSSLVRRALASMPGVSIDARGRVSPPVPLKVDLSDAASAARPSLDRLDIIDGAPLSAYRTSDCYTPDPSDDREDVRQYMQQLIGRFPIDSITLSAVDKASREATNFVNVENAMLKDDGTVTLRGNGDVAWGERVSNRLVSRAKDLFLWDHRRGINTVTYHALRTAYAFHHHWLRHTDAMSPMTYTVV